MDADTLGRLREHLEGATEAARALGADPVPEQIGHGYLSDPALSEAIDRIATSPRPVALLAGAGVSMEAGPPSWLELRRRLWEGAGTDLGPEPRRSWIRVVQGEGPLAAAAVGEALLGDERAYHRAVRQALYRDFPAESFRPQALAHQIAWFKRRLPETQLLTLNYDGMLEEALAEAELEWSSFVDARPEP